MALGQLSPKGLQLGPRWAPMWSAYAAPKKAVYPDAFPLLCHFKLLEAKKFTALRQKTPLKRTIFAVTEILSHKILCPLFPLPVHLVFETRKNIACNFDFPGLVQTYSLHTDDPEHVRLTSVNPRTPPSSSLMWRFSHCLRGHIFPTTKLF